MDKMVSKVDHFLRRIIDKKKFGFKSIKFITKEISPRRIEFQEVIEIALLLFVSFFALVKSEYMIRNEETVSVEKILHTSDEPSRLQCLQRCRWIDKNAAIHYDGEKCQCLKHTENKDITKDSLTGIFAKSNLELGFWGRWKDKGSCSVTCGNGQRTRVRKCWTPPHIKTEVKCLKLDQKTRSEFESNTFDCNKGTCPKVDGNWGQWTEESCHVTCGTGNRYLSRKCNNPAPANGGLECLRWDTTTGARTMFEKKTGTCNAGDCPQIVHGGWTPWNYDGGCDVSCGDGSEYYHRTCENPFPMNGGDECTRRDGSRGHREDKNEPCYMGPCDPQ